MSKVAVVYWTGTGNTQEMAEAVVKGAKDAGAEVDLFEVDSTSADAMAAYDGLLFGCPAMGAEVLEEGSFEPFFADVESKLSGKPVGLFGSYGWGGGEWMRDWEERTKNTGANLIGGLDVENAPDSDAIAACEKLGADVVAAC